MYVSLLRLYIEVAENPLLFVGLIVLLIASWGLIISAIGDIIVRLFDVPSADDSAPVSPRTRSTL